MDGERRGEPSRNPLTSQSVTAIGFTQLAERDVESAVVADDGLNLAIHYWSDLVDGERRGERCRNPPRT